MAELFDIVSIFAVCKMLSLVYSVDYNESIEVWSKKKRRSMHPRRFSLPYRELSGLSRF